ncbi:ATPase [Romboutsia sp. 1001713B170131_170501_G6]|uniref:ATPase n=1 Tax=Romboutsia sp. 1001713B170131_170501_G6 TaxID=2787108 RepID=UPI0018AA597B|nr:ATPase [Romboutsia sp. 1001713B170131_170501_G6]
MYKYALDFLNEYVEIYSYLSKEKLYGEIIRVTPIEVVLNRKHIDKASNKNYNLYIPLTSIIYIKKL